MLRGPQNGGVKKQGLGVRETWDPPLTSRVVSGKLLNIAELLLPYLYNKNNSHYLTGLFRALNQINAYKGPKMEKPIIQKLLNTTFLDFPFELTLLLYFQA